MTSFPPTAGFTRAHLRRLIREGKLVTAGTEGREPQVRLSDLPRKTKQGAPARLMEWPAARAIVAEVVGTGRVLPHRRKNRKSPRKKFGRRTRGGTSPPLARRSGCGHDPGLTSFGCSPANGDANKSAGGFAPPPLQHQRRNHS